MGNDLKEILVTAEDMDRRLAEMAEQIDRDYAGEDLLLVGVLRGAVMVMADLSRKLHTPLEMDWMAVSSYGSGTKTSGVVRILKDLDQDVAGRHVLIVEDITDSGLTLSRRSTWTSPTWASIFPTSSSSVTAWITPRSTATCPSSARCSRTSTPTENAYL